MPPASQLGVVEQAAPADRDDLHPGPPGGGRDPDGGLAAQALDVERPLARDHQVRPGHPVVEAQQVEHQGDPGAQLGPERAHQGEPDPARGARAGMVAPVAPGRRRDHVGPVAEGGVEDGDVGGRRPLLRAVDRGGAVRPGERVVHVAGHHDPGVGQAGVQPVQREVRDAGEGRAPVRHAGRRGRTERGQQPRPAVGAGATADPHDQLAAARVQRGRHHLAETAARRSQGCPGAAGEPLEPAGVGHLDHGGGPPPGVRRLHRLPRRAADRDRHPLEPGRDRGVQGAVAAVGHRQALHLGVRDDAPQPARHGSRDVVRRERALELVGGQEDAGHRRRLPRRVVADRPRSGHD